MNMFFHTSAATVGMTKNGAITRMRTIPWPPHRLVEQQRKGDAADHRDQKHADHQHQRVEIDWKKAGSE
jgi:hypothetical protein